MKKINIISLAALTVLVAGGLLFAANGQAKSTVKPRHAIKKVVNKKVTKKVNTKAKAVTKIAPKLASKSAPKTVSSGILYNTSRAGEITRDETWSGQILVTDNIEVKDGATLTILPGTTVKFQASRDYKNPRQLVLGAHGRLKAIGTKDQQIRFTSDALAPQNGDWSMIRLYGKTGSEIRYAIIEFGQQGVNLWQSDAVISHSIIRWNNWEGLYAESYSTPLIEYNHVYQNGYNGMALEQYNNAIIRSNIFEKNGTHGVHLDATKAVAEKNIFRDNFSSGFSVDDKATASLTNNTITGNKLNQIKCGQGDNKITATGNKITANEGDTTTDCSDQVFTQNIAGDGAGDVIFDYPDPKNYDLGYTPGDRIKDRYLYVYPDDETRKIVKKIGKGLGLTWAITMEWPDVWTADVSGNVYKLSGETGEILKQFKVLSPKPWGMAFDGEKLWITDFAEKRTYSIDPQTGQEIFSFNNPDREHGAKGVSWDGKYLYIMGWTTDTIYQMDRSGKLISTAKLKDISAGGGLTWDGHNFWIPCGSRICKFSAAGQYLGGIYAASEGTWDLAWEPAGNKAGGYLWASQRTNENWHDDEKIFKLEILDDSLKL